MNTNIIIKFTKKIFLLKVKGLWQEDFLGKQLLYAISRKIKGTLVYKLSDNRPHKR